MYLRVDVERCQGHARCAALAPEFYDVDDLGNVTNRSGPVDPDLEGAARLGVDACPERALEIE